MNSQTPGPLQRLSSETIETTILPVRWVFSVKPSGEALSDTVRDLATGELACEAYNVFDRAGRDLGVDAVELARSVDLVEVLRYALDYAHLHSPAHTAGNVGRADQVKASRQALAPLAELLGAILPR